MKNLRPVFVVVLFIGFLSVGIAQRNPGRRRVINPQPAEKPANTNRPSGETIPTPEYYGLYVLVDDHLCGLNVAGTPCSLTTSTVNLGARAAVGNVLNGDPLVTYSAVRAIELKKGVRLLSYQESNPSNALQGLRLIPMIYIRNVTVDTGWPSNVKRSGTENAWDSGNPSELGGEWNKLNEQIQPIDLLIKPLKDKIVLGVPSRELTPGLYRLSFGQQIIGSNGGVYFWFGSTDEAQIVKCVDATYTYAMMLSKAEFKGCEPAE